MKLTPLALFTLLASTSLHATTVSIPLCNTGRNAACTAVLALGSTDSHWDTRPVGSGSFTPALVVTPLGTWLPDTAVSQWIGPSTGIINPAGVHRYQLDFNLASNANLATVTISGRWSSDNEGNSVRVNGVDIPTLPLPGATDSNLWNAFTINASNAIFQTGANTLEFRVRNRAPGGVDTATGFRAEFTAAQFQEVPEPAAFLTLGAGLVAIGLRRRRATIRG